MSQRYEVKGKIGQGGLGEVYLAHDTQLDREVAIKRVKPPDDAEVTISNLENDLIREARTLSALQHPNIVTIYDVGRDTQGPYVVMELLKGETLDDVISRGKLSIDDFKEVVLQVLEGLTAAQALGLVHRDLKPGNVMVNQLATGKLSIKILDFGLAKFSKAAVPQTADQGDGIFGSIWFMAPEQFERLPLDARTDLYSAGCIFYQILTQEHPFYGTTPVDVMVSHLQHAVAPIHTLRSDLPRWMADWVMWLISREMDDRPRSARVAVEFFNSQRSPVSSAPQSTGIKTKAHTVRVVGRGPAPSARTQPIGGTAMTSRSSKATAKKVAKKSNSGLWITLTLTILTTLGLGVYWLMNSGRRERAADPALMLDALSAAEPMGDAATIASLLKLIESGTSDTPRIIGILKKLKGSTITADLASELTSATTPAVQLILTEVIASRPSKQGTEALLRTAANGEGEVRLRAIAALETTATPPSLTDVLLLSHRMKDSVSRAKFGTLIETTLARTKERPAQVKLLAQALQNTDSATRPVLLKLLVATGTQAAGEVMATELTGSSDRRKAAIEALQNWTAPDSALTDAIFAAAKSGGPDAMVGLYARLVSRIAALSNAEIIDRFKKALPLLTTESARNGFFRVLSNMGGEEVVAFLHELIAGRDVDLANAARPVAELVEATHSKAIPLVMGENRLPAASAKIVSDAKEPAFYSATVNYVSGWKDRTTRLAWDLRVAGPITAMVEVSQSTGSKIPRTMIVRLGDSVDEKAVITTQGGDDFSAVSLGPFRIPKAGNWRLWLEPGRMDEGQPLMAVREVIVTIKR